MTTMSISRGLIELKNLEKRIAKKIAFFQPVTIETGGRFPIQVAKTKAEFIEKVKADYQSIVDLIDYRRKIKSAIVNSNAVTQVEIGGEKFTVAEAIERKSSIEMEKQFTKQITNQFANHVASMEKSNMQVKSRLDQLLHATFSKESAKVKDDEYEAVAKPFLASNEVSLVDPIGAKNAVEKLEEAIDAFLQNIDICLTESNARTEITV